MEGVLLIEPIDVEPDRGAYADPMIVRLILSLMHDGHDVAFVSDDMELRVRVRELCKSGSGAIEIDTTRPELLAACVALVAHPDDERYQPYFGTAVTVPLYGQQVEICAHELAQPDKGTGIAMICTFGDTTDVTWWRELNLPILFAGLGEKPDDLQPFDPDLFIQGILGE